MESTMLVIWFIVIGASVVIDIMTSAMIFVWFGFGALGSIIAYMLGANIAAQIIIFCILSVIGLIIGYPFAKKVIRRDIKKRNTMEENYIGKEFVAETDIENKGHLKVEGIYWTVLNEGDIIKKGEKFKIIGIKGTKLMVSVLQKNNK